MLKQLAWNTFKNTGNIDTLIELEQVTNVEKDINQNIERNVGSINYGNNQDKGNSNFRK